MTDKEAKAYGKLSAAGRAAFSADMVAEVAQTSGPNKPTTYPKTQAKLYRGGYDNL